MGDEIKTQYKQTSSVGLRKGLGEPRPTNPRCHAEEMRTGSLGLRQGLGIHKSVVCQVSRGRCMDWQPKGEMESGCTQAWYIQDVGLGLQQS